MFVVLLLAFEKLSSSWSSNVISCCWSFCIWEVVRRVHRPQLTNCLATRGGELSLKVYLELDLDLITMILVTIMILMMTVMTKLIVNSMTILIISSPMLILSVFLKLARNLSKFCLRFTDALPTPSSSWWKNDRNNDHHDHSKFCLRCSNILATQRIARGYVMKSAAWLQFHRRHSNRTAIAQQ